MDDRLAADSECVDEYNDCLKKKGIQGILALITSAASGNPLIVLAVGIGTGWWFRIGIRECRRLLRLCLERVEEAFKERMFTE